MDEAGGACRAIGIEEKLIALDDDLFFPKLNVARDLAGRPDVIRTLA